MLRVGKAFVQEIVERSKNSLNLDFYGRAQLLDMLIPWLGYNTLARKAQTMIVDKFYMVFVGLMHRTRKIRYMEKMLFYSLVKRVMPRAAHHILYDRRHLVVNISSDANSKEFNFHFDESQEALITRDVKRMSVNDSKVLSTLAPRSWWLVQHLQQLQLRLVSFEVSNTVRMSWISSTLLDYRVDKTVRKRLLLISNTCLNFAMHECG